MNWNDSLASVLYWRDADGKDWRPCDMTTEHLKSVLDFVMRKYQIKLLLLAIKMGRKDVYEIAIDPFHMRELLLLRRPVLAAIEHEFIRRGESREI